MPHRYLFICSTNNYNTFSGIRAPVTFGTAYTPRGRYQLILKKLLYQKLTEVTHYFLVTLPPKHHEHQKHNSCKAVWFKSALFKTTTLS